MSWARGLTRTQWLILAVAWLGWVFDIMDTALFNFAKEPMLTEMLGSKDLYKLHGTAIEGNIQMVFLIGWAIGGLIFGLLADRWGRTRVLILTILSYSVLTGLTALCRTPDQVAVVRFLSALGIGGEWAAGASLVAETFPDKARAGAAALLQSAAAFGPWFAAIANLRIHSGEWRTLFLVGIAPALVCVAIRLGVQEPESSPKPRGDWLGPLRELMAEPQWRRNALIATLIGIVGITGAGIVSFWLPNLVSQAGKGLPAEYVKNFKSYNTFTFHIGTLLGVLVFPWLCVRFGRKPSFAAFFILAPLSIAFTLYGGASLQRLLILLPVTAFFSIGLSAGFVLYFPELFPPRFRATGSGLAYNVGRIAAAPMPAFIGWVIGSYGGNVGTGVIVASSIYVLGLVVLPFARETRGLALPTDSGS